MQTDCALFATALQHGVPDQVSRLREFYRSSLLRHERARQSAVTVDLRPDSSAWNGLGRGGDDAMLGMAAPPVMGQGIAGQVMPVAFDLAALVYLRAASKRAVLAPWTLNAELADMACGETPLRRLALLQSALRRTEDVIVFDPAHMRELALLGACRIAVLPLPAFQQAHVAGDAFAGVLILAHGDRVLAQSVAGALRAALPAMAVAVLDPDCHAQPPMPGALHLHLGAASPGGHRIIDSFAAGSLVVQLLTDLGERASGERAGGQLGERFGEQHDVRIEHMRTGILAYGEPAAAAAVRRLAGDAALRDILGRHASQAAACFNHRIDDQLWRQLDGQQIGIAA